MITRATLFTAVFFLAVQVSPAQTTPVSAQGAAPLTDKIPVSMVYPGVTVTEDYRWLEDSNDSKVKAWVAAQNAYTQDYVSRLPQRERMVSLLKKRRDEAHIQYFGLQYAGGRLFALKYDPQKSAVALVVFRSPEDRASEQTVVDLEKLEPGKIFQASWYKPSMDGALVGLALGVGGSEDASLYVSRQPPGSRWGAR